MSLTALFDNTGGAKQYLVSTSESRKPCGGKNHYFGGWEGVENGASLCFLRTKSCATRTAGSALKSKTREA